jgi:ribosome-associated protein
MKAQVPEIAQIADDELHFEFIRSSGPGGQNVNKVATAVQLRFDARNSRSIASDVRERLFQLAGKRANTAGEIIIDARRFRTQQRNKEDAVQRLMRLIEQASIPPKVRRKSRPTAASKEKRITQKKRRSQIKRSRTQSAENE